MKLSRRTNLNLAIKNLTDAIDRRDIPDALFDANALTCVGSGFPLFSCGWRIARHLQKSLYYHADKVTVHDSDLGYLGQIVNARYRLRGHHMVKAKKNGIKNGQHGLKASHATAGRPPMLTGVSSVKVHDKNGTHYHVTERYLDSNRRVHVTDGQHDELANHNEAVADGKEAL